MTAIQPRTLRICSAASSSAASSSAASSSAASSSAGAISAAVMCAALTCVILGGARVANGQPQPAPATAAGVKTPPETNRAAAGKPRAAGAATPSTSAKLPSAAVQKAATTMAVKAVEAYKAGNFNTAQRLFWQAYRLDRRKTSWAYGAARASHKLGRFAEAAARYRAFLRAPGDAPTKVPLARRHLASAEREQSRSLSRRAAQAPGPAVAYRHALAAAQLQPRSVSLWLQAAEYADSAKLKDAAIAAYRRALKIAVPGSAEAQGARARIAALTAPVQPTRAPPTTGIGRKDPASPQPSAPQPSPTSPPRWAPIGVGIAGLGVVAVGVVLFMDAGTDEDALHAATFGRVEAGALPSLSLTAARREATRIGNARLAGWVAVGAGAAAVFGALGWYINAGTTSLAVRPRGSGVIATWTGRW